MEGATRGGWGVFERFIIISAKKPALNVMAVIPREMTRPNLRMSTSAISDKAAGALRRPGMKKTGRKLVSSVTPGSKKSTNIAASLPSTASIVIKKTNMPTSGGGNLVICKTLVMISLLTKLKTSIAARDGTPARR